MSRYKTKKEKEENFELEKLSALTDMLAADYDFFVASRAHKASIKKMHEQRRFHRQAYWGMLKKPVDETHKALRQAGKTKARTSAYYHSLVSGKVRAFKKPEGWPFS